MKDQNPLSGFIQENLYPEASVEQVEKALLADPGKYEKALKLMHSKVYPDKPFEDFQVAYQSKYGNPFEEKQSQPESEVPVNPFRPYKADAIQDPKPQTPDMSDPAYSYQWDSPEPNRDLLSFGEHNTRLKERPLTALEQIKQRPPGTLGMTGDEIAMIQAKDPEYLKQRNARKSPMEKATYKYFEELPEDQGTLAEYNYSMGAIQNEYNLLLNASDELEQNIAGLATRKGLLPGSADAIQTDVFGVAKQVADETRAVVEKANALPPEDREQFLSDPEVRSQLEQGKKLQEFYNDPMVQEYFKLNDAAKKNYERAKGLIMQDRYQVVSMLADVEEDIAKYDEEQARELGLRGKMDYFADGIILKTFAGALAGFGALMDAGEVLTVGDEEYGTWDVVEDILMDAADDAEKIFPTPTKWSRPIFTETAQWDGLEVDFGPDGEIQALRNENGEAVKAMLSDQQKEEIKAQPRSRQFNAAGLPYQIAEVGMNLLWQVAGTKSVAGPMSQLGASRKLADTAGVTLSTLGTMAGPLYEEGLEVFDGDKEAAAKYMMTTGTLIGLSSTLFGLESKLAGGGGGFVDDLFKMKKSRMVQLAATRSPKDAAMITVGSVLKEALGESFEETVLETIIDRGVKYAMNAPPGDIDENELMSTAVISFAVGALGGIPASAGKYNEMQRQALNAAIREPDAFIEELRRQVEAGIIKIPGQEGRWANEGLRRDYVRAWEEKIEKAKATAEAMGANSDVAGAVGEKAIELSEIESKKEKAKALGLEGRTAELEAEAEAKKLEIEQEAKKEIQKEAPAKAERPTARRGSRSERMRAEGQKPIGKLVGRNAMRYGVTGEIQLADDGAYVLVDKNGTEHELARQEDQIVPDLKVTPARTVQYQDKDNVKVDGQTYAVDTINRNEDGDLDSVVLIDQDGKKKTFREKQFLENFEDQQEMSRREPPAAPEQQAEVLKQETENPEVDDQVIDNVLASNVTDAVNEFIDADLSGDDLFNQPNFTEDQLVEVELWAEDQVRALEAIEGDSEYKQNVIDNIKQLGDAAKEIREQMFPPTAQAPTQEAAGDQETPQAERINQEAFDVERQNIQAMIESDDPAMQDEGRRQMDELENREQAWEQKKQDLDQGEAVNQGEEIEEEDITPDEKTSEAERIIEQKQRVRRERLMDDPVQAVFDAAGVLEDNLIQVGLGADDVRNAKTGPLARLKEAFYNAKRRVSDGTMDVDGAIEFIEAVEEWEIANAEALTEENELPPAKKMTVGDIFNENPDFEISSMETMFLSFFLGGGRIRFEDFIRFYGEKNYNVLDTSTKRRLFLHFLSKKKETRTGKTIFPLDIIVEEMMKRKGDEGGNSMEWVGEIIDFIDKFSFYGNMKDRLEELYSDFIADPNEDFDIEDVTFTEEQFDAIADNFTKEVDQAQREVDDVVELLGAEQMTEAANFIATYANEDGEIDWDKLFNDVFGIPKESALFILDITEETYEAIKTVYEIANPPQRDTGGDVAASEEQEGEGDAPFPTEENPAGVVPPEAPLPTEEPPAESMPPTFEMSEEMDQALSQLPWTDENGESDFLPSKTLKVEELDNQIQEAEKELSAARSSLENKAKSLDETIMDDTPDLFGDRRSQAMNPLFDERVDASKRDEVLEPYKQRVRKAEAELRALKDLRSRAASEGENTLFDSRNKSEEHNNNGGPIGLWTDTGLNLFGIKIDSHTVGKIADYVRRVYKLTFTREGLLPNDVAKLDDVRVNNISAHMKRVNDTVREFKRATRKHYGKNMPQNVAEDLDAALKNPALMRGGPLTLRGGTPIPTDVVAALRKMREQVTSLSTEMVALGIVEGDLAITILDNLDHYLTRSYRVHTDKDWLEKVKDTGVWQRAEQYMRSKFEDQRTELQNSLAYYQSRIAANAAKASAATTPEARRDAESTRRFWQEKAVKAQEEINTLTEIINSPERLTAQVETLVTDQMDQGGVGNRGKLGSMPQGILNKRKDIDKPIRDLFGEYNDPVSNFAQTIFKQAHLVENAKFLREVEKIGLGKFLFPPGEQQGVFTHRLAAEGSKTMSPLNGYYTSAEIKEAFEKYNEGDKFIPNWLNAFVWISSRAKFAKTILSPVTQVRNFYFNAFFMMANGYMPFGKSATEAFKIAASSIDAYERLRGGTGMDAIAERMYELGVLGESVTFNELKALLNDMSEADLDMDPTNWLIDSKAGEFAQQMYQFGDEFWRVFMFLAENNRNATRMYNTDFSSLTPAQRQAVELASAENVNRFLPTYSRIPKNIRALRVIPFAGTFVSFPYEAMRTTKNSVIRLGESGRDALAGRPGAMKEFASRLVGLSAVITLPGIAAAIGRYLTGFDDEDEDKMRWGLPPWSRSNIIIPISRDGDKMDYVDVGFIVPQGIFMNAINALFDERNTWPSRLNNARRVLTDPFFSYDMSFEKLMEVYEGKRVFSDGRSIYAEDEDWTSKVTKSAGHVFSVLEPGFVTTGRRIGKAFTNPELDYYGKLDPEKELMTLVTGIRVSPTNFTNSHYFISRELGDRKFAARKIFTGEAKKQKYEKMSTEEKRELLMSHYEHSVRAMRRVYKDAIQSYHDLAKVGAKQDKMIEHLKSSGFNAEEVKYIVAGIIPPTVEFKGFTK
jgi:hypothetical protein